MAAMTPKQHISPACLSPVWCLQSRQAGVSSLGYCAEEGKKLYSELGRQQPMHVMER